MSENSVTRAFDDSGRQQQLETVMAEYIRACDAGAAPDRQVFLERYPELAEDLRDFFSQRDHLNQLAGPIRGLGDALTQSVGPGKHISYVGDYELLEEVARGGMGVVYKARQKTLGRIVAVKMMLTGRLANEDDVKRFQIEAQAAANLQHPNIVPIHEVGQHEGLHYFSMDFVEGRSLSALLRDNVLPPKDAANIVRIIAEAIHYAHQQGTLHRDLKPSNILMQRSAVRRQRSEAETDISSSDLCPLTTDLFPRITDFGLAMRVEGDSGLTHTGQILGTPSYMPPEQAQGLRSLIGPGSDVYSMGAILYECLTGRAPFRADSVMKTIEQVIHREAASPRLLNAGIARDLETICLKCLEKEPHRRYGTAQLLADDLQRFLEDRPILARPVGVVERTWRWCRRNPAVAALTLLVAVSLVVGITVSSYFAYESNLRAKANLALAGREKTAREQADERKQEAEANATLARRHLYVAHMNLAQAAWEATRVGETVRLLELYRRPAAESGGSEDFRGFEWYYWDRLCHRDLHTLTGHTGEVRFVAFSPDGKRLASACRDKTVKVWNTATGREELTFKGHTEDVYGLAFSPDGQRIASGSHRTIKVWDAATGREAWSNTGHGTWVTGLAFSPDGKRLASVCIDDPVKVWDATSGQELLDLKEDRPRSVAFSPDGKSLATTSGDYTCKLWDAESGQKLRTLEGHSSWVETAAFSADGRRLVTGSDDRTARVWDTKTGQLISTLRGHTDFVKGVAFSPDGLRCASGSQDQTVKVWDAILGKELFTLKGHSHEVQSVAFSSDGLRLASASSDRTVKIWDAATSYLPFTLKDKLPSIRSITISPDQKRLAWLTWSSLVKVWDGDPAKEPLTFKGNAGVVPSVLTFSPDGQRLASNSSINTAAIWDAATGQELHTLQGHSAPAVHGAFSPDGQFLATASWDNTVKLWDANTGKELRTLSGHTKILHAVAYRFDGQRLASACSDGSIKIWDTASGREVRTLTGHTDFVASVAFSPDGKWLASASWDRTIKLWDAETGHELRTLSGHASEVRSVAFSSDSRRLVSASSDRTVKVWDTVTGQETITLKGHAHSVEHAAISRDGTRIVSLSSGAVMFWDTADQPATKLGAPETLLAIQTARQRQVQGDNFRAEKQYAEAIACYRDVVRSEPTNLTIVNRLAWLLVVGPADVREPVEGMRLAQQAVTAEPDSVNYRMSLGAAQFRSGQFDDGLKSLERVAGANSKNIAWRAQNFFLQALCHEKLGQRPSAQAAYAKGLELSKPPHADSVHWHEAKLLQIDIEAMLGNQNSND